jgi:hypothetical protein
MTSTNIRLTGVTGCISFTNAACPKIARRLTNLQPVLGSKSHNLGSGLQTKLKLNFSSVIEITQELRRNNVESRKDGVRRILPNKPNFRCIFNPKKLNSGFLSLFSLALKQVVFIKHALRNRYMQNQHADQQTTTINMVTVEKCAELVGWTKDAINALRVKGKIRINIHWIKRNGRIFIDMAAFQQWIRTGV